MKNFLLTICSFIFLNGYSQDTGKSYFFKQVGWSLNLPPAFKILDSAANAEINEKGRKVMESALEAEVDISSTTTLFSATLDVYNYFNATLTPYNPSIDGDWYENNQLVKNTVMEAFKQNMQDAQLDSTSSNIFIDGLGFEKFEVVAKVGGKVVFTTAILSKLYNGYDFGISYLYMDEKILARIQEVLDKSKFQR